MLNIPQKSESKLVQLIELRKRINDLEIGVKMLMPSAINEALDNLNGQGNIVYKDNFAKAVMVFRKSYHSINENVSLKRLDEDIIAETQFLANQNKIRLEQIENELEQLQEAIAKLEIEQESLLTSPRLINLKKRFEDTRNETETLEPNLAVYITK